MVKGRKGTFLNAVGEIWSQLEKNSLTYEI